MTDEPIIGQRYSLLYLKPSEAVFDSERLRKRLAVLFLDMVRRDKDYEVGLYLERELGIDVLRDGFDRKYIRWDDIKRWELRDVLCVITLLGHYANRMGAGVAPKFHKALERILSEEATSYRLDEKFGIHPAVDTAYQASIAAALRGLGSEGYEAARGYVTKADDNLLPQGDTREAIRSIFDAVENVFKIFFEGAIALNQKTINSHLSPFIDRHYSNAVAKRAAQKICASLIDWADACHNYRHAAGEPEPEPPPEELAVTLVMQGLSHLRWLIDLRRRYSQQKVGE